MRIIGSMQQTQLKNTSITTPSVDVEEENQGV